MAGDVRTGQPNNAMSSDEIKRLIEAEDHDHGPEGDWRGPYGYGHRAYRPDPEAQYGFDPGPTRTLPQPEPAADEPVVIWKRPLR
jgi:hypothetical protein